MKSDKKTSVRFPSKRLEELDKICSENGNCSRSKVIKNALDYVIDGKSDINFELAGFSKLPRKTIEFIDDHKILADCPHCKGKIRLDPEHYKKFKKTVQVLPSFIPGFNCKDDNCDIIHPNENYSSRPTAICSKCYQFAKKVKPQCSWCLSINSLRPVDPNYFDQIGIPKP